MRFLLNINQSLDAIKANLFRAGVTIFIIALGICALIVVMTSIDGVKSGLANSFSTLGANTFRVRNWGSNVQAGGRQGGRRRSRWFPRITYYQAVDFKERFAPYGPVSISASGGGALKVTYGTTQTNQNVSMTGADENYPKTARYDVSDGRHITADDVAFARNVIVLGYEVAQKLFPNESPVGKIVNVRNHMYKVVGAYDKVGTSSMSGGDKIVVIPISTLRNHNNRIGSLRLNVFVEDAARLDYYMDEARGLFRLTRKLRPSQEDNFSVTKSDAFVERFMENMKVLTYSAQIIALITLLGASVALLNVMLVSVTERTNEIGLRKAMGATRKSIMMQFLIEAIVICQLGGLLGIFLGLAIGNVISTTAFNASLVVPMELVVDRISCLFWSWNWCRSLPCT